MQPGLYVALSSQVALQKRMETIADNVANAGTVGFRATQVLPGRQANGRTEILNGLTGAERVASTNAFLLKAELAKGEAEHED